MAQEYVKDNYPDEYEYYKDGEWISLDGIVVAGEKTFP